MPKKQKNGITSERGTRGKCPPFGVARIPSEHSVGQVDGNLCAENLLDAAVSTEHQLVMDRQIPGHNTYRAMRMRCMCFARQK